MSCLLVDKAGSAPQNGSCFAADNQQRLLAEEAELDRMVKELQATLPPSEGSLCHISVLEHNTCEYICCLLPCNCKGIN